MMPFLSPSLISFEFGLLRERLRVKRLGLGFTKSRLLLVLQLSRVSIGALLPRRHGAGAAGQASAFMFSVSLVLVGSELFWFASFSPVSLASDGDTLL